MPDAKVHTMSVREHVRGGYRELTDAPHLVLNGGEVAGVWYPGTTGITIGFPGAGAIRVGPDMRPVDTTVGEAGRETVRVSAAIMPVPKPSARKPKPRRG